MVAVTDDCGGEIYRGISPGQFLCISVVVTLVLVVGILVYLDSQAVWNYRAEKKLIKSSIPIGTDIDDARAILIKLGYIPSEKYHPTAPKDYYWVDIQTKNNRTPVFTWLYPPRSFFRIVALEAGLDGKVRKIL